MFIGDLYYLSDMSVSTFLLTQALILFELYAICLLSGIIHVRNIKQAWKQGNVSLQELREEVKNVKKALFTLTLLTLVIDSVLMVTALTV